MMHMTFYWGRKVTLMFDSWKTDSWSGYAISLFICFLIALSYQYLEDRRIQFKLISSPSSPHNFTTLLHPKLAAGGRWSPARFAGAILFGINASIGYLLMLAVMSYNGGVFLAVVVGLAVGYLLFRSGDGNDVAGEDEVAMDSPCGCA